MSEWWTYSLADFLLFSPRAYYALIASYNRDVWPLHLVAAMVGVAIAIAMARPDPNRTRMCAAVLGAAWVWIGWAFMWQRYVTINWAATWPAAAFVLQGLLLLLYAAAGPTGQAEDRWNVVRLAGVGLFIFALLSYPVLAPLLGRNWQSAEVPGIAPDPTAVATLAWLAVAAKGPARWLMMIPALWCAITGATLWAMGAPEFFLAPVCALMAIAIASKSKRSALLRPN